MKHSAGLLLYRRREGKIEVLLVHPGGPFWERKEEHAWSMPKGEINADEEGIQAALREFREETGFAPKGAPVPIGSQKSNGKIIEAWALEGDWDPASLKSNNFSMEWPPRSGKQQTFPEADRAAWFDLETAQEKLHKNQLGFLKPLEQLSSRE